MPQREPAIRSRRLIWTETARTDLVRAYQYLAELNQQAADRLILGLETKARMLAESGLTGRDRSDVSRDIRSIAYRSRILFFRATPQSIIILRVLHGHQQVSSDQFPEQEEQD